MGVSCLEITDQVSNQYYILAYLTIDSGEEIQSLCLADQRQVFDKESESLVINTLMHFKKQVKTSKFLANILGLITSFYRSPCGIMKAAILRSTGYDLDTNDFYDLINVLQIFQ